MIEYRHFRNCDSPGIVELWRSQPPLAGRVQPLSTAILEHYVLSKAYFDPRGLIVAHQRERIVGFAHAGFGADEQGAGLSHELGVISMLMVDPHDTDPSSLADALIARAEQYLRGMNAKVIYGGGIHPVNPFYLGLYGGSELPGILKSDVQTLEFLQNRNYSEIDQVVLMERELAGFRPKVDRATIQARRKFHIEATFDPPSRNWWEACHYGLTDRTRFVLRSPQEDKAAASVTFWDLEPLASSWGIQSVGLVELATSEEHRRQGLATFLVGEALRQLQAYGVTRCQVQAMQHNQAALGLYQKLGFEDVDRGIVLRKNE